jgi:putative alpha-1,2-mannosidase
VRHEELEKGAHLVFTLGPQPNKTLAVNEAAMPPSLTA